MSNTVSCWPVSASFCRFLKGEFVVASAVIRLSDPSPDHHRRVFEGLRLLVWVQLHYTPVHLQPYYRRLGFREGDFPEAEAYASNAISLPLSRSAGWRSATGGSHACDVVGGMTHAPELCLGTVQFGLSYGITNQAGQVPEPEVRRILDLAAASGISLLDTAQAYGTAETVLGRCWPTHSPRRLISKLPAGAPRQSWEESLITSLQRLQESKLDGFLLHRATDLLAPDGEALLDWLEGLRDRELVERIGVSIYDASELEGLPLDRLQLVQFPYRSTTNA